jgi:hypothetical protein
MTFREGTFRERSVPAIVADLANDFTTLLRKEGQLARAELSEKISQLAIGLGFVIAGAVLIMPGLVVLLEAGVAALEKNGWAPHWSALAVGGGTLLVGLILLSVGVAQFRARKLVPARTLHQLGEDAAVVKQQGRQQGRHRHEQQQRAA